MNAPEVVRRYAITLLEAADETGAVLTVQQDVAGVVATLEQSEELADFLVNPLIGAQSQASVLREVFSDKVSSLTLNFLQLVAGRGRGTILRAALGAFLELIAEREGVVDAEVRSAAELTEEQCSRLQERLERYTGRKVRLAARVDHAVRGGVVARIGDTVFDGSVNTHLERLRKSLAG